MTNWRVMLSHKLWNQYAYNVLWATSPEANYIAQSKGRCRMVLCPAKDDTLVFVMKGHIAMKGIVKSNGFMRGDMHRQHSCNTGEERDHAAPSEYALCEITEICEEPQAIRKTGQRTWLKYCE
jgi:hypothetical protein